jgi:hypothetical protein
MIDRINTSKLQDILANTAAKEARNAEPGQNRSADASLQADYAALIKQASAASVEDKIRVQRAAEMINTGQLDTAENRSQAARNIAQFGV